MTKSYKFCIRLAAGCYTGATSPIISRHLTLDAAISAAKRSDRLAVYALDADRWGDFPTGDCLFVLPPQGPSAGRYGRSA